MQKEYKRVERSVKAFTGLKTLTKSTGIKGLFIALFFGLALGAYGTYQVIGGRLEAKDNEIKLERTQIEMQVNTEIFRRELLRSQTNSSIIAEVNKELRGIRSESIEIQKKLQDSIEDNPQCDLDTSIVSLLNKAVASANSGGVPEATGTAVDAATDATDNTDTVPTAGVTQKRQIEYNVEVISACSEIRQNYIALIKWINANYPKENLNKITKQ